MDKKKKVRFRRTKKMIMLDAIQRQHEFIAGIAKNVLKPQRSKVQMEYDDLVKMDIDEHKQKEIIRRFTYYIRWFLFIATLVYFYALYLFISGDWFIGIIALSIFFIFLANAFKYHFWRYQLMQKKLGLSFTSWLGHLFIGKNHD